MPHYFFQWNDDIVDYIAQHGVTPEEFEQVVQHPIQVKTSRSTGRNLALGEDSEGVVIACVYEFIDKETVVPITAYRPSEK
jgi:uncharacterized DUF497 family protein